MRPFPGTRADVSASQQHIVLRHEVGGGFSGPQALIDDRRKAMVAVSREERER